MYIYHILSDGVLYDNFELAENAEECLLKMGWVKDSSFRWRYRRPGRATLFATVERRPVSATIDELVKIMKE